MTNAAEIVQELDSLKDMLSAKDEIISNNAKTIQQKNSRIKLLEDYIRALKQQQYGSSSEKLDTIQVDIFDEDDNSGAMASSDVDTETDSNAAVVTAPRKTRRVSIPKALPRVEVIHDLPDADKVCPHDGATLKHIGSETHEQLDIVPAKIQVLTHVRLKYACPCCEQYVITAQKPAQPIEKSIASPGLLSFIATQKYVDAQPLYRQVEGFKRIGIELDRATLADWMKKCGALLQPLINLLHERMLQQTILHMDETRVQVLNEPDRAAEAQSYMWVLRSTQSSCSAVLFNYEPTRSGSVPSVLLQDFNGALMVDGYAGYNAVCTTNRITRLGCWAHVRRKFIEAQKIQPKGKTGKADQGLAFIQALYRLERDINEKTAEEKTRARQQQAQPILDKIRQWLEKSLPHMPPQTPIGKALQYLHQQWPHLIHYVNDGAYPIDNNPAENAIRPFVIGRKNWLFSTSQKGATSSANLYSLIETAKANDLEPSAYLRKVFTELPNAKTLEDVEALLPWCCKGVV